MKIDGIEDMAIVGNGGSIITECRGAEIDSRFVVARFNNYILGPEHLDGTGKREDVWITSFYTDIGKRIAKYDHVLCPFPLNDKRWDAVYVRNITLMEKHDVMFISPEIFIELESHIPKPSTGISFLFWYYRTVGKLDADQVYGFSFFKGKHHYFDNENKCNHNGDAEENLFYKMVKGDI